jgi:hypothetical protein
MKNTLAFVLFAIMLLDGPLYAQSLCSKCIEASQAEVRSVSMRPVAKRIRSLVWRNRKSMQRAARTVSAKLKERKEGVTLTSLRRRNRWEEEGSHGFSTLRILTRTTSGFPASGWL